MRNKGAIWTLAIVLTLICAYQLAFTWKGVTVRQQAELYATNTATNEVDPVAKQYFLDSVATEKIYFFNAFTYRDVLENELNFGLDLKGGMNVILEISVTDVLKNLSSKPTDTLFVQSLKRAHEFQKNTSDDFITSFGKAFNELAPEGAQLETFFQSADLRDKIDPGTSNDQVIRIVAEEAQGAIDNAFNIISARIDQLGLAQPNIQKLETNGRILVDLPGVKDKARVRKLLQNTANLEFWLTYDNAELQNELLEINTVVAEYLEAEKDLAKSKVTADTDATATTVDESVPAETEAPSLLAEMEADTATAGDSLAQDANVNYPLFQVLMPRIDRQSGSPYPGASIGSVHFKDTAKVNKYMQLARNKNILPRNLKLLWSAKPVEGDDGPTNYFELYALKVTGRDGRPPLDGDAIVDARMELDPTNGEAYVSMTMNAEGAGVWARLTRENLKKSIAVVMDNLVYSAPTVQSEIKGGRSQITGNFSQTEATDLANLLESGKLPAPARIIQETVVGPSLGQEAIDSGSMSFLIAFLVILIYMLFYYSRNAGLAADIALIANMFFIIGVLASLGAALTLPGIAGIVLTIGMSVDANVLIYERIREELSAGKGLKLAVKDGYKNAYSAIIDANVTTLITAIILLLFGTGPIKGFATTLVIGILTSLFSAIFITRLIVEINLAKNKDFLFSTKMTEGWLKNTKIKFLEHRKKYYFASGIILVIGLASLFGFNGLDLGVDFTGGRNFIIKFEEPVKNSVVAEALAVEFGEEPKVISYGQEDEVRITTRYMVDADGSEADEKIQHQVYQALLPIIGDDVSYETFFNSDDMYWQGSQKVGATIADDILRRAFIVIGIALLFMFMYIISRFRNWQFGLGAVAALIHDSLIVLGLFSLLKGMVPFSLEIDQAFIAAILTVVGYSINDTVVVYDRIREFLLLHPKRDRREIMNLALNSTISRTFNTSISTFIVLLTIFLLGGEAIKGFTFALMVGVVVGTYSSLFIATPLVYDTVFKGEKNRVLQAKKRK